MIESDFIYISLLHLDGCTAVCVCLFAAHLQCLSANICINILYSTFYIVHILYVHGVLNTEN